MKNWEFYEKVLRHYAFNFTMKGNQAYWCLDVPCDKCMFHTNAPRRCDELKLEWLYQEYKEPVVLTEDEKSLCKLLGRGWIARDKDNSLWWYKNRPKDKLDECWWCIPNSTINIKISKYFPQCKFEFIKWEDKKPWEVKVDD